MGKSATPPPPLRAMPKCLQREFAWGFPYSDHLYWMGDGKIKNHVEKWWFFGKFTRKSSSCRRKPKNGQLKLESKMWSENDWKHTLLKEGMWLTFADFSQGAILNSKLYICQSISGKMEGGKYEEKLVVASAALSDLPDPSISNITSRLPAKLATD